jgi:ABC-type polysaccharide/polyol phosphate transport system ATPase subunit
VNTLAERRPKRAVSGWIRPPGHRDRHVAKTFRLPHQQYSTLKERALHPGARRRYDELRALRDVDVTHPAGRVLRHRRAQRVGKCTLLKCLAGIYRPDAGRIEIRGGLSPFIELGSASTPT